MQVVGVLQIRELEVGKDQELPVLVLMQHSLGLCLAVDNVLHPVNVLQLLRQQCFLPLLVHLSSFPHNFGFPSFILFLVLFGCWENSLYLEGVHQVDVKATVDIVDETGLDIAEVEFL